MKGLSKKRRTFELEILGGLIGLALIVCTVWAVLNYSSAQVAFCVVVGLGALLNGILAYLQFVKKHYPLSVTLIIVMVALLVLLAMQILLGEGLVG